MKSDREFINGIYEKAKLYEEKHNVSTFQKRYYSIKTIYMAAILVIMVTSGVILYQQPWRSDQPIENNQSFPVAVDIKDSVPDISGVEQPPKMVRGIPFTLPEAQEVILEGVVTSIEKEEGTIYILPSEIYTGDVLASEELKIVIMEGEMITDYLTIDESVLVYLQQNQEDAWSLSHGVSSIYSLVKEEESVRYYKNQDGLEVNTLELKEVE